MAASRETRTGRVASCLDRTPPHCPTPCGVARSDMPDAEKTDLLRRYAANAITWRELQERGFADYVEVLGGLGELGLRPPIAPMTGPNVEARKRGIAILEQALRRRR